MVADLRALIDTFIDGEDRSVGQANAIEVALDETFGDREPYASAVLVLASYQPSGGEFLYDERAAVEALRPCQTAIVWIARFEALLPALEDIAAEVRRRPSVLSAVVGGNHFGGMDGFGVSVDCLLKDIPDDQADNVALRIVIAHLTRAPELTGADVCWGHPSGHVDAEIFEDHVALTEDVLARVIANLPELGASLLRAIDRGTPSR